MQRAAWGLRGDSSEAHWAKNNDGRSPNPPHSSLFFQDVRPQVCGACLRLNMLLVQVMAQPAWPWTVKTSKCLNVWMWLVFDHVTLALLLALHGWLPSLCLIPVCVTDR